jgi:hypothetical protein
MGGWFGTFRDTPSFVVAPQDSFPNPTIKLVTTTNPAQLPSQYIIFNMPPLPPQIVLAQYNR